MLILFFSCLSIRNFCALICVRKSSAFTPHFFRLSPQLLALDPPFLRGLRRLRLLPRLGPLRGFSDKLRKPRDGVLPVPLLGAVLARLDEQDPVLSDAPSREADEARSHVARKRR